MTDQWFARRRKAVQFMRNESKHGSPIWAGLCQKVTRTALGVGPGFASAILAWQGSDKDDRRYGKRPPAGVPVYWDIGVFGHAAISAGNGNVWSTDIKRRGHIDKVSIDYLSNRWNAKYLGWTETINGERVYPNRKQPK